MELWAATVMWRARNNSGQSCNALSRMLVPRSRRDPGCRAWIQADVPVAQACCQRGYDEAIELAKQASWLTRVACSVASQLRSARRPNVFAAAATCSAGWSNFLREVKRACRLPRRRLSVSLRMTRLATVVLYWLHLERSGSR